VRLRKFSVANYRSISSTPRIAIARSLTVVGPNNEGKSNLVRALVCALKILEEHARTVNFRSLLNRSSISSATRSLFGETAYNWATDCPMNLQIKDDAASCFYLEFDLDDTDVSEFNTTIGSSVNGLLPIEITIGKDGNPKFLVKKPGKGQRALSEKSVEIAKFIGQRLSINHIPAIRTAAEALSSVGTLAAVSMRAVEASDEYKTAMETIEKIQAPVFNQLEADLTLSLQTFLPSIKKVTLGVQAAARARALRTVDINIDDGQDTPLANKGDGVISLVGLALLARLNHSGSTSFNTILAIEEPESHLHPRAIHSIRGILDSIGDDYQVIVTTHSPVLANRLNIQENVIVQSSEARVATDISQIRDALGVRVSDNLSHARIVVICEGPGDELILKRVLGELSSKVAKAIRGAELSFLPLSGSGNLPYQASLLQQSVSEPMCFLDDDLAGREAANRAIEDNLVSESDVIYAKILGKSESEIEDLIDIKLVQAAILKEFKVDITTIPVSVRKKKFSVRMKAAFEVGGKMWSDSVKSSVKFAVSEIVSSLGIEAIPEQNREPLLTLVRMLEEKI
jgi:putative ATP-dependent endonuclease of the OLD family